MAKVKLTAGLQCYFPELDHLELHGDSVKQVLHDMDMKLPGILDYVVDEKGMLRSYVNIFLRDNLISDRQTLSDKVEKKDELFIFQALSGQALSG